MAWREEIVNGIVAAAQADWQQGRLHRKFEDDMADRKIGRNDVVVTLSKRSIIIFYCYDGRERFGFYHPRLNLFIAWSPAAVVGRLLSLFHPRPGRNYLDEQTGVIFVWQPK
ncbi:MAG: hypothetical protein NZT92_04550 [Abditibacteriales bacterium]|nr:hypothetical protein [Abditibacteriales bacterium]MDW8365208.1 hypothetical protein [Abditibacteriales bacterium]